MELYSPDVLRLSKIHNNSSRSRAVNPKINTKRSDNYVRVMSLHCLLEQLTGFTTMAGTSLFWSPSLTLAILKTSLISTSGYLINKTFF